LLHYTGSAVLRGPFWLVLADVSSKARMIRSAGSTRTFHPVGSPYLALGFSFFRPGTFLNVTLEFINPTGQLVHFTPHVLAGPGPV
jgi:hypothetical protein